MAKFCANCGSEINENADICLKCGVLINKDNMNVNSVETYNQNIVVKTKVPGKGLSVAGMVLGIIAAVWVLIKLFQIGNIEADLTLTIFSYYTTIYSICK